MSNTAMLHVPEGMKAGDMIKFQTADGQFLQVPIPVGVNAGDDMVVQLPAASPVPMGIPVQPQHVVSARSIPSTARYAECPICFEPLHAGPVGVFVSAQGKRVSNHFFRLDAAREWLASGNGMCPITRTPITSVAAVPAVQTDPDGWFAICDINRDGKLSRKEALECLKAQYAVDVGLLDQAVADESHWMWQQWDSDRSGFIERHELLAKPNGLVASIQQLFPASPRGIIPDMRSDKAAWYDFFDADRSGSLEQEEVVRALIKTLGLSQDQPKVREMRETVQMIWPIFDHDGSGSIERGEYLKPNDGLADTILATLGVR